MARHEKIQQQAASFDRAAEVYERARPEYPAEAVEWMLPADAHTVLDLGAGTGKLTRALVARGLEVFAVDPSPKMLDQLRTALPGATVSVGTAEDIPLADTSVDAVVVGQAWHWVDQDAALPSVARVLRPGGTLGLIWNLRDERVAWVERLTAVMHPRRVRHDSTGPVWCDRIREFRMVSGLLARRPPRPCSLAQLLHYRGRSRAGIHPGWCECATGHRPGRRRPDILEYALRHTSVQDAPARLTRSLPHRARPGREGSARYHAARSGRCGSESIVRSE
jgi:SAM-dependent methyltransferase